MSNDVYTGRRGMMLEGLIETTNVFYGRKNIAQVQKIATPIKVLRSGRNGYFYGTWDQKSTVDFVGVTKFGKYICFDAKETSTTNLPLANIKPHQLEHMKNTAGLGGEAFLIVYFKKYGKCFRLPLHVLYRYMSTTESKSIPYKFFVDHAIEIPIGGTYPLNYLCV